MKQKIELTFEAFKQWLDKSGLATPLENTWEYPIPTPHWQSLCAEAEKREPVVLWAVVSGAAMIQAFTNEELALQESKSYIDSKVIKLQEVNT